MSAFDLEGSYLGIIRLEPSLPGASVDHWLEVARRQPNVVPEQPLKGINPFTRKPMNNCDARIMAGRKQVGLLQWYHQDDLGVAVFGEPGTMLPLARTLAELLGGCLELHKVSAEGE